MDSAFCIDELVPHSGRMSFLSSVVHSTDEMLNARGLVKESNPFRQEDHIPGWVGVEYMAQAISAWAGVQAKLQGNTVELGFLLGTRSYSASVDRFALHSELDIMVRRIMQGSNGLGVFDCQLFVVGAEAQHASARINVFQPPNVQEFLRGFGL